MLGAICQESSPPNRPISPQSQEAPSPMRISRRYSGRAVIAAVAISTLQWTNCGPREPPYVAVAPAPLPGSRTYAANVLLVRKAIERIVDRWEGVYLVTADEFGYETSFVSHAGPRRGLLSWERTWEARTKVDIDVVWTERDRTVVIVNYVTEVRANSNYPWAATEDSESAYPEQMRYSFLTALDKTMAIWTR